MQCIDGPTRLAFPASVTMGIGATLSASGTEGQERDPVELIDDNDKQLFHKKCP